MHLVESENLAEPAIFLCVISSPAEKMVIVGQGTYSFLIHFQHMT